MKKLFLLVAVVFSSTVIAQTNRTDGNASNISNAIFQAANANSRASFGASAVYFNPARNVDGSAHLFKDWDNKGIIYANNNKKYSLSNINLNLERNAFESKVANDSIFTFDFNNIERFVVNNKTFKSYYDDGENKIFQELYEGNGFQILKGYNVKLVKGSDNPMLNRPNDKYVQKEYFYVRKDNTIKKIKLKKKDIMNLVQDKQQAQKILNYVKQNS